MGLSINLYPVFYHMSESSLHPPNEETPIRCPRLGGPVYFGYCLKEKIDLPCNRIIACWTPVFDADSYFRAVMSPEEFEKCFCRDVPSKMTTLMDLIEKAKSTLAK
jgi:hypothetical protein